MYVYIYIYIYLFIYRHALMGHVTVAYVLGDRGIGG